MKIESLKLSLIRTDAGTQSRVCITEDVVAEYAARMDAGDVFPPVIVFKDREDYYLADGFHRVNAAMLRDADTIEAEVRQGGLLEAITYAVGANRSNGLRRTNGDKRRCVTLALQHFANLSDRAIAEMTGVDGKTVASVRNESGCGNSAPEKRTGRDGKAQSVKKSSGRGPSAPPTSGAAVRSPAEASAPTMPHTEVSRSSATAESEAVSKDAAASATDDWDSETLTQLKRLWTEANAGDRAAFLKFIEIKESA